MLFCGFQDNEVHNFFTPFRAGDSLLIKPNLLPCMSPSCTLIHAPITHHNKVKDRHSLPPPQIGIFWIQPSKERTMPSRHLKRGLWKLAIREASLCNFLLDQVPPPLYTHPPKSLNLSLIVSDFSFLGLLNQRIISKICISKDKKKLMKENIAITITPLLVTFLFLYVGIVFYTIPGYKSDP